MRSFGPGLRRWREREEKEPKEDKAFRPGEKWMEGEWEMDMDFEEEVESRKKLDEQ